MEHQCPTVPTDNRDGDQQLHQGDANQVAVQAARLYHYPQSSRLARNKPVVEVTQGHATVKQKWTRDGKMKNQLHGQRPIDELRLGKRLPRVG
jgi:hypothetical protein